VRVGQARLEGYDQTCALKISLGEPSGAQFGSRDNGDGRKLGRSGNKVDIRKKPEGRGDRARTSDVRKHTILEGQKNNDAGIEQDVARQSHFIIGVLETS